MVEELVKLVIEEGIGAAFSGVFRKARSRRARCLKIAAWTCAAASLALFITAAQLANENLVTPAAIGGAVGVAGFLGFGVWAAIVNVRCEFTEKT